MKTYTGARTQSKGCVVSVDAQLLDPRHDLYNHSPDGFEWGYGGSGPAQLALAILADWFNTVCPNKEEADRRAIQHYQDFKRDVIAGLTGPCWSLKEEEIAQWVWKKTL